MKNSSSLVTVIIPVYNGAQFIEQSIKSVLQQDYQPVEIIVVDDGSTDGTESVIKGLGEDIIYLKKNNGGPASARNLGLKYTTGNYVSFIDADDLWPANKLTIQLDAFNKLPETGVVLGFSQRIKIGTTIDKAEYSANPDIALLYSLGSALIRKEVFDKVGFFDEEMLQSEDTDWFLRVMEQNTNIELHYDIVQYCRYHQNNITNNRKLNRYYQLKAFKKSLDRRRESGSSRVPVLPKPNNLDEIIEKWKKRK